MVLAEPGAGRSLVGGRRPAKHIQHSILIDWYTVHVWTLLEEQISEIKIKNFLIILMESKLWNRLSVPNPNSKQLLLTMEIFNWMCSLCLLRRLLYSTLVVSLQFFNPFPGYYFFNTLLLVLQALHIFWAYLILRMVYKFVFLGKVSRVSVHAVRGGKDSDYRYLKLY